jgi:hypothetical protein
MAISFALSEVVALAVESFCYGIYFALFGSSVKLLLNKRKTITGAGTLLALAGVFVVLITWHVVLDAVRMVNAFRNNEETQAGNLYYGNVASSLSLIKTSVYLAVTILFDGFILHRCFIIWERNLLVILLPFLIFLSDIGTGIASVQGLSGIATGDSVFLARQEKIAKSFFSSTVAVNGLCSLLIAYRVWLRQNPVRDSRKAFTLSREGAIIIESAAIYFVTLICLIATWTSESNAYNVFLDAASPIIGVAFTLIVIRMGNLAIDPTHISMQGMGDPIPEDTRSVAGSMTKEPLPQSEGHAAV